MANETQSTEQQVLFAANSTSSVTSDQSPTVDTHVLFEQGVPITMAGPFPDPDDETKPMIGDTAVLELDTVDLNGKAGKAYIEVENVVLEDGTLGAQMRKVENPANIKTDLYPNGVENTPVAAQPDTMQTLKTLAPPGSALEGVLIRQEMLPADVERTA